MNSPAEHSPAENLPAEHSPAELLQLDHVVIAVHELEAAMLSFRAAGFTVQPGGSHPGRSSHNALIVFQDGAYIELIAWTAPAPQERWWRVLQEHGEGYVDFALLPRDTAAALAAAQARGLRTLVGPFDGGRVRPDGAQLKWCTARHETPDLPFLCGDITPRALRVPEGAVRIHSNGCLGIAGLEVAVEDLAATLGRYQALLGSVLGMEAALEDPAVQRAGFTLGSSTFALLCPGPGAAGDHPLRKRLAGRGPGVVRMQLLQPLSAPGAQVLAGAEILNCL